VRVLGRAGLASWFPGTDTIRTPLTWGFCPEDGSALPMELFSQTGGRAAGVIGMTGIGKSNLLNNARDLAQLLVDEVIDVHLLPS